VLVFGSVALGHVDEQSDVDVLFICRDELSPADSTTLLKNLGESWSSHDDDNPLFGRWHSGFVDGIAVDVHYQTASLIESVLAKVVEQGAITTAEVPFRPYTLAALLQRAWVIVDKDGLVQRLRQYVAEYPPILKRKIVQHFAPRLEEYAQDMLVSAERRQGAGNFIFFLNRAVDAMISILFAVNENYDPAEKHTEKVILPTLAQVPDGFIARFTDVLEGPFDDNGALDRARRFTTLTHDVLLLAQPYLR
jgi:hypothetical protein